MSSTPDALSPTARMPAVGTSSAEIEAAAARSARRRVQQVYFWRYLILVVFLGGWEVLSRSKLIDVFSIYIKVFNSVPRVVLAPIFILMFGLGLASKVALSFVMVFFVVFANAFQGVREADRNLLANAQILGARGWQLTNSVVIPSAMSWIFASLHVSFGFAIVGAIVGEFVGARYGIGLLINVAKGSFDAAGMYAAIVIIMVVALAAEYLMTMIESRLAKWRPAPLQDTN